MAKVRRKAFTPEAYRHLHTYARKWVKEASTERSKWSRTVAYNFVLIMDGIASLPTQPGRVHSTALMKPKLDTIMVA